jgi:hypothetical protein
MKKLNLFSLLLVTTLFDPLEGNWVNCYSDEDGSYLYLTRFQNKQRVEVLAFSKSKSCGEFPEHAQVALVINWSYEISKDHIDQNLVSEKIATFEDGGIKKCNFLKWIKEFDEKCLRDVSEFKHQSDLRENRMQKRVSYRLDSKKVLILSDGIGEELYKVEK